MKRKYFGEWSTHGDMVRDFSGCDQYAAPTGIATDDEVLLASYDCESYEGSATVLFRRDGKVFEVYASHCSCMGLEGQWSPGNVTAQYLVEQAERAPWQYRERSPEFAAAFDALLAGLGGS